MPQFVLIPGQMYGVSMGISTKKGDDGYTGTRRGERILKYHIITEALGP